VASPSRLPVERCAGVDATAAGGMTDVATDLPVTGRLDSAGRLIAADPPLAALQASAGGSSGGPLSVPQIAALARLAKRLGITVSRAAIAADADADIDLWVRAEPEGEEVALSITGWQRRPARAAEAAPAAVAARDSDFLRAASDWTWETDDTLRITALSPGAAAAIGRLPADLIGKQITRLFRFHEDAEGDLPLLAALAEHGRFEGQIGELRGGTQSRYLLSGVPLIDGMGRFAGFRGGAFRLPDGEAAVPAAGGAPDAFGRRLDAALRGPIDKIVGQAEKLGAADEGPLAADYAGYAADIAAAGRHLLALVDDLVDLQAIERPDFRPAAEEIDLADIARRAAGLLGVRAADKQVRIDGPDEGAVPATGDFTRTLQILVNLLGNAVRYSPEGGQVWLRAEREGDLALVIVADQGKGIAEADQERVFEKFERVDPSEPGGAGLGLYIARKLARAMKGDLAVHSAPGQGARFTLTLPAR
jgi:signal transduction histidine kinase